MATQHINTLIDDFNALPAEEQEFAVDLIRKTYTETRRDIILKNARKATQNEKKGNVKRGNVRDLYSDLEND